MDSASLEPAWGMGRASKVDRDPAFLQALIEHGSAVAELFLPARAFLEGVWNEGDGERRRAAAERLAATARPGGVFEQVEALHEDFAPLRVAVKDMGITVGSGDRRQGPCGSAMLVQRLDRPDHRTALMPSSQLDARRGWREIAAHEAGAARGRRRG